MRSDLGMDFRREGIFQRSTIAALATVSLNRWRGVCFVIAAMCCIYARSFELDLVANCSQWPCSNAKIVLFAPKSRSRRADCKSTGSATVHSQCSTQESRLFHFRNSSFLANLSVEYSTFCTELSRIAIGVASPYCSVTSSLSRRPRFNSRAWPTNVFMWSIGIC